MNDYILYYDSGTSNTRAYLLDRDFAVKYTVKKAVGSKDSAIAGSNAVLIRGLKELYDNVLSANGLEEGDISAIYASGMITCAYGLKEVPHMALPLTVEGFAGNMVSVLEDTCFHREIILIPGLKTVNDDITYVNNMRGEEIEIIGALDELQSLGAPEDLAMILPGSHTHVTYLQGEQITGIISNFTGELFHAIQKETILSPVLTWDGSQLDREMVLKGYENLQKFGFNRALYICRAMDAFGEGDPAQRFSYGEGVILGGVRQSLEYYCQHFWPKCRTAALVSDEFMYQLFSILFEDSPCIDQVLWLPISEKKSYGVSGLKKLLSC